MARIHKKIIRKNYYGKANYAYESLWLYIPKKFHNLLQSYMNSELEISIQKSNGKILIALTPKS
ncbi:MAG: hypothetical protein QXX51_08420 [Candidatus Bathyarchaeia archaeon]